MAMKDLIVYTKIRGAQSIKINANENSLKRKKDDYILAAGSSLLKWVQDSRVL